MVVNSASGTHESSRNRFVSDCANISVVVPTKNRIKVFGQMLASLEKQRVLPTEMIVVDASGDEATKAMLEEFRQRVRPVCSVRWMPANIHGAAAQRNQGVAIASQPFILFCDDDILFEPGCIERLWRALEADIGLGGVSAMITNQKYHPPGLASRTMFTLLHGRREKSYAGRVIGPAVNLLPEDREDLPDIVPVDWLNLGATIYRREALPSPPFDSVFTGYSMMEDLTLSLRVGRKWKLANARTARIFHDSQPGFHKADNTAMAEMELVNRYYVMTQVLGRKQLLDYCRLFLWEAFQWSSGLARASGRSQAMAKLRGQWRGMVQIRKGRR